MPSEYMPGEGGIVGGREGGREGRRRGKEGGRAGSTHQQWEKELVMHLASEGPFAAPSCAGLDCRR